jgi:hypothetical protein
LDYVSSQLLHEFFEKITNDEIDFEFLELLKKRLVANHSDQPRLTKRWKIKPKVLLLNEIKHLFQLLNSYFGDENNPICRSNCYLNKSIN